MRMFVKQFIRKVPDLVHAERSGIRTALDKVDDLQLVCDLVQRNENTQCCPHCGATRIHKHGTRSNLQRYKCTTCHKAFNALTGTPLAHLRKKELWLKYADQMLLSNVLRTIAIVLHCDKNTAFRWRHRFSAWLYKDRPETLAGIVEADETYLRISQKVWKHLNRKPHKRGGDDSTRGLSKKQVCVLTACDRSEHSLEFITGLGPVKGKWLDQQLAPHIAHDAVIVTDRLQSYTHFCREQHLEHKIIKGKKDNYGSYHIQHINAYHSRIKGWINGHFRGVATKYLNHYLWWRHELENKHILSNIDLFKAVLC